LDERKGGPGVSRKPRADAERNRIRLIEVARATFTELGAEVALEEIARRAGVGIGTLYRHFPTRDALLSEVYRHAVEQLAEAAGRLSQTLAPVEALREWLRLFVDYIATKQVMAPALGAMPGGTASLYASSGPTIKTAIAQLIDRAVAHGDIGGDIEPLDLLKALMGVANVKNGPGWQASAHRLIDILIDGLRAQRRKSPATAAQTRRRPTSAQDA
jgi:AcrR family transcriptional regulator